MSDLSTIRVGFGMDIHRLKSGGRLMLAGVCVSESMSADAHSDGDVVLHALTDALLGAMGQGDIGQHFSNTDPRWAGASSHVFVEHAMRMLRARGGVVNNVDVCIQAERPKLATFREAMTRRLSELVGGASVNIKAGTNEGVDAVGQGLAIAANVAVLIRMEATASTRGDQRA
jgi:2-C-methyl-D-erythritol 2,4-cyclodiphosphate synthase